MVGFSVHHDGQVPCYCGEFATVVQSLLGQVMAGSLLPFRMLAVRIALPASNTVQGHWWVFIQKLLAWFIQTAASAVLEPPLIAAASAMPESESNGYSGVLGLGSPAAVAHVGQLVLRLRKTILASFCIIIPAKVGQTCASPVRPVSQKYS